MSAIEIHVTNGTVPVAEAQALLAEVERLVAETQRLTRELAEKQAALDRNWQWLQASDLGAAALRAAGQELDEALKYARQAIIEEASGGSRREVAPNFWKIDKARTDWARLTTKEPSP